MEISTDVDRQKNLRRHTVRGVIDINELTEYLKNIYNSPDLEADMNVFWDLQKADLSRVSPEEVKSFLKFVSNHWGTGGKSKAALVVSRDLEYGMSRMYQLMLEMEIPSSIEVFRDRDEAEMWIQKTPE